MISPHNFYAAQHGGSIAVASGSQVTARLVSNANIKLQRGDPTRDLFLSSSRRLPHGMPLAKRA
jgi:hypothetical protein